MNNFYDDAEKVLKRLDDSVALLVAQMKLGGKLDPEDVFFDNGEFMKLMNISKRTAQEWRKSGSRTRTGRRNFAPDRKIPYFLSRRN